MNLSRYFNRFQEGGSGLDCGPLNIIKIPFLDVDVEWPATIAAAAAGGAPHSAGSSSDEGGRNCEHQVS